MNMHLQLPVIATFSNKIEKELGTGAKIVYQYILVFEYI